MHGSSQVAIALQDVVHVVLERFEELEVDEEVALSVAEGLEVTCQRYVEFEPVPANMDGYEALDYLEEALESASEE